MTSEGGAVQPPTPALFALAKLKRETRGSGSPIECLVNRLDDAMKAAETGDEAAARQAVSDSAAWIDVVLGEEVRG